MYTREKQQTNKASLIMYQNLHAELIVKIALETMKRHGYEVALNSDAYENNPVIRRYFSDAQLAIQVINRFVIENNFSFDDLDLGYKHQPEATEKTNQPDQVFPTWEQLGEWVDKLYKFWKCDASDRFLCEQYEPDKQEALRAYMTPDQLVAFYEHLLATSPRIHKVTGPDLNKLALVIVRMLNPYPGKIEVKLYFNDAMVCVGGKCCEHWANSHGGNYTREIACVIPEGLNPIDMSLTEILSHGKDAPIEAWQAPKTAPTESTKPATKLATQSRVEQYRNGKLLEVQLYFDSNHKCLGVHGKNFSPSYQGMFAYSWCGYLPVGLNPFGKHIDEICGDGSHRTIGLEKTPQHTNYSKLTKYEKELLNCFVGREVEFERFRVIKRELLIVEGIKIGALITSRDDIKGWYASAGKDKAALYWTPSNGWEISTRDEQDELTGVFEGFDLIAALEQNDIEVNGISANDWHNARCEEAEAEAVALQQKERTSN